MTKPSKDLIKFWYDKLKQEGFKDIESGHDLNKYSASTFGPRVTLVGLTGEKDVTND